MMYKVISPFVDLQDGGHAYKVGDTYPRQGAKPTEARVAQLASANNRQHKPLIESGEETKDAAESLNLTNPAGQTTPAQQDTSADNDNVGAEAVNEAEAEADVEGEDESKPTKKKVK